MKKFKFGFVVAISLATLAALANTVIPNVSEDAMSDEDNTPNCVEHHGTFVREC